jgi:PAS domain S-box-containing protein
MLNVSPFSQAANSSEMTTGTPHSSPADDDWLSVAVRTAGVAYRCHAERPWTIVRIEGGCQELFGYSADHILQDRQATFDDLIHHDDRPKVWALRHKALRAQESLSFDYRICRSSGEVRWVRDCVQAVAATEGAPQALTGMLFDITESQEHQLKLQHYVADAEQHLRQHKSRFADIHQEFSSLVYAISHDLRSPLRIIDGFASILREDYQAVLPEDAHHCLDTIVEHTNQLGAMIEAMMNFSRLNTKPLALQPMLPTEVVRQVFEELSANEIGRCIKLDVAELPGCQADPQLMRLVWRELVHNALKWTRGRDVAQITVGYQHANGVVVYCVSDNGTGFDMRYSGRLFGLFQRLHSVEEHAGLGMGLASVRRIIDRHGGRVWLDSHIGGGTHIYFTIEGAA